MMKTGLVKFTRRFLRRSQSGQSIVILALGFVALLGFVGIVTDVSVMFVRFSTLTRAVDAASIAAAGQVRRQVPFASEVADYCTGTNPDTGQPWSTSDPCPAAEAAAFARGYGNIGVAARQFIEFYGLNPQAVLIDMCFTVSEKDPGTGDLVPIDASLQEKFDELCVGPQGRNADRKLIKVTAQIDSPTIFLRLLGFDNIPLEASSISETAVLDVVMIMDVSESMLNQTTYTTWADQGYTDVYRPPDPYYYSYHNASNTGFGDQRGHDFSDITGFSDYSSLGGGVNSWYAFRYDLAVKSPDTVFDLLRRSSYLAGSDPGYIANSPFKVRWFRNPGYSQPSLPLREECRVAYFPTARSFLVPDSLKTMYANAGMPWVDPYGKWDGFVPAYDFYRCCNDPDGNGQFNDLLCQPFRQARDATEQFLQRVDFLRGDRVAFVTFDRQAFLVTVEDPDTGVYAHMIDNETLAINTLRESIGVRSEPSFYEPNYIPDPDNPGKLIPVLPWAYTTDNRWARSALMGDHDYEVNNNCPFQDAAGSYPLSPTTSPPQPDPRYSSLSYPNRLTPDAFKTLSVGQRMYPRNDGSYNWQSQVGYSADHSYDMWASCRGTNIGAALRAGANALLDPRETRTNGSVWVMVMLSDGAAGASDPVFDSDTTYNKGSNPPATQPDNLYYPYSSDTYQVTYGGLGLCPPGKAKNDAELTKFDESPYQFPFCGDQVPETRHFCFDPNNIATVGGETIHTYVDLGKCTGTDTRMYYDVDDYARDWADWIALAEPPGLTSTSQRSMSQLPTVFTIGFGLNFNAGTTQCKQGSMNGPDVSDCLGEELLRYVADAGDNFRIDSDYEQALITNKFGVVGGMTDDDFGPRGECEEDLTGVPGPAEVGNFDNLVLPKTAGTSCGNYYNAPSGPELNRVFDDIASRMFTRLTQ